MKDGRKERRRAGRKERRKEGCLKIIKSVLQALGIRASHLHFVACILMQQKGSRWELPVAALMTAWMIDEQDGKVDHLVLIHFAVA